jgi:hypothetical protein
MTLNLDLENGRKYQPLEKELGDLQELLLVPLLPSLERQRPVLPLEQVLLLELLRNELVLEQRVRRDD